MYKHTSLLISIQSSTAFHTYYAERGVLVPVNLRQTPDTYEYTCSYM